MENDPTPKSSTSGDPTLEIPLGEENAHHLSGAIVVGYVIAVKVLNDEGSVELHTTRYGTNAWEALGMARTIVLGLETRLTTREGDE